MPRVLIIGLGLMGGSAGLALREAGWDVRFLDPEVAHAPFAEKVEEPRDEDVILLATHIDGAIAWLPKLHTRGVITSLCSVMQPLREVAPENFVAGHPMAGSHESGLAHADAKLYRGKAWFLDGRDERVEQLVRDCGANARVVSAEEHDAAVAVTSHLPQLLSTALAAHLHDRNLDDFAGSGLRDFLRLAQSSAEMWGPIVAANADQIRPHADATAKIVDELLRGDTSAFTRARAFMKR
ncbi:MAG TPA: prephenate dehydrogenase/arogenate dehydrogenase family protein [Thermoanaerobaculia bacterium]|nr:prephenate dehydrogenase/arogenate dehydrogenase family protein [Thermoanaerobaculia bacterium]